MLGEACGSVSSVLIHSNQMVNEFRSRGFHMPREVAMGSHSVCKRGERQDCLRKLGENASVPGEIRENSGSQPVSDCNALRFAGKWNPELTLFNGPAMTSAAPTALPADRVLPYGKDVEVFYDAACPLCRREIGMLQRKDKLHRIQFTDLTDPQFDPAPLHLTLADLEARIHGRLPDGRIIQGMEVFRQLYTAIGWGWLANVTRWPGVSQVSDLAYTLFAKNRLRLTGRCKSGQCELPASR